MHSSEAAKIAPLAQIFDLHRCNSTQKLLFLASIGVNVAYRFATYVRLGEIIVWADFITTITILSVLMKSTKA